MMRRKIVFLTSSALLVLVTACSPEPPPSARADHVFTNGVVYTLDDASPVAEAVAVKDDRIVYVGAQAGLDRYIDSDTQVHDLGGQLLLPGFIDSHLHLIDGGAVANVLVLDTLASPDEWMPALRDYADEHESDPLIFGYGFIASAFGLEGPQREMLDAVVSDKPVLIMDEGFHNLWVNTRALEALGITRDTPDPQPGFSFYMRDTNGNATGFLLEGTAVMAVQELGVFSPEGVIDGTTQLIETLNRYGVTSVFDAGVFNSPIAPNDVLRVMEDAGHLSLRVVGSNLVYGKQHLVTAVPATLSNKANVVGENYHYNTLKIMYDGVVESRTAAMFEDYQGDPGNSGETTFTTVELEQMVSEATAAGLDVHIHGLGERAIHDSLNAIEGAKAEHPDSDSRFTICHIQVITDDDVHRFAALGVVGQSTPVWATYDDYGKVFVSEDQFQRFWRFNSLRESGARLSFGSDFPATGVGELGLSPILQMEIGHTRQLPGEPDALVQPRESERLSIANLIRGYTIDAAYQLRLEDRVGSIEVGKKADLVVVDKNLFEIDAYSIHDASVVLTMFDGRIVYEVDSALRRF